MKKRVFVAIKASEGLQKKISDWQEKFAAADSVRVISSENLHITLIPPWYEENVDKQIPKLKKIKGSIFNIEFKKVTFGPNLGRPRLIWAEGETSPELYKLKSLLDDLFPEYKSKHKNFILHMTLARFNPDSFSKFEINKLDEEILWQDNVSSFVLMQSHLSRTGANYEVLEEFPLLL